MLGSSHLFMREMHLLEIQNPYPDCVLMNLEAFPHPTEAALTLVLNISFHEQWKTLLGGRIKFGLKRGIFKLQVKDCEFFPQASELETVLQFPSGTVKDFSWQFSPLPQTALLKASSQRLTLGTLKLQEQPCHLIATFEIRPSGLTITDAEGLWRPDISPNKHAIIDRLLARYLVQHYFSPAISWLQLAVGNLENWDDLFSDRPKTRDESSLSQLEALIHKIYDAPTQKLKELCQLAGLESKLDLAGGNFLGATLSGEELSHTELVGCNFRGAILTDADLSESDLDYAILTGADLSGAYLESARLRYADFRKGSLALANLISSDLSRANLQGTIVNNANFSGAIVTDALFGDNPGMTVEMRQSLMARGAKFLADLDSEVLS